MTDDEVGLCRVIEEKVAAMTARMDAIIARLPAAEGSASEPIEAGSGGGCAPSEQGSASADVLDEPS